MQLFFFCHLVFKTRVWAFPVGGADKYISQRRDGGWGQPAGRYGRREAISSQPSPPYRGRQLALRSALWLLRTEKENGAETKSSAPILPLSATKFVVIARTYHHPGACKINTMPCPVGRAPQVKKPRVASVHYRPSFWTIAAREWRRRDLVSGTPFLSFKKTNSRQNGISTWNQAKCE